MSSSTSLSISFVVIRDFKEPFKSLTIEARTLPAPRKTSISSLDFRFINLFVFIKYFHQLAFNINGVMVGINSSQFSLRLIIVDDRGRTLKINIEPCFDRLFIIIGSLVQRPLTHIANPFFFRRIIPYVKKRPAFSAYAATRQTLNNNG